MPSVSTRRGGTSLGANPALLGLYHSLENCHVTSPMPYETQPFVILQACDYNFQISTAIIIGIVGNNTAKLIPGWLVPAFFKHSQEVSRGTYSMLSEPLCILF